MNAAGGDHDGGAAIEAISDIRVTSAAISAGENFSAWITSKPAAAGD